MEMDQLFKGNAPWSMLEMSGEPHEPPPAGQWPPKRAGRDDVRAGTLFERVVFSPGPRALLAGMWRMALTSLSRKWRTGAWRLGVVWTESHMTCVIAVPERPLTGAGLAVLTRPKGDCRPRWRRSRLARRRIGRSHKLRLDPCCRNGCTPRTPRKTADLEPRVAPNCLEAGSYKS